MPLLKKPKVLYNMGKVMLRERGLQTTNWDQLSALAYNPDEIGIATYKEMMKDAQVRAGFNLIKFATMSRNWKVVFSEKEKKSEEIVSFIRHVFDHMDGRLDGGIANIVTALPYGFSVTELVFKIVRDGKFKGKIGLKKMKGLDPDTITFKTDKYGNLKKVLQNTDVYSEQSIKLPIERLIIYTNEKEFGNYYGTSRLRSIYKNWFVKNAVIKFWNIALERFGMPMLIGKVPSSKDLEEMKNVLENAQAKTSLATVEGWEVQALETGIGRSSGGDYSNCIEYHNNQILKGLIVPGSLLGDTPGGSFAKSKVGFDLFQLMLKSLEIDLCGIIEEYLIKPLIVLNYGEMDSYPQFVFEPLTKAEFLELAKVFALLVRNGVVGADETWMRDMMRVPKRSETSVSRDTRKVGKGEEAVPSPPAETKVIKTDKGKSPVVKKPTGPTQQVKTPKPSRNTGMGSGD